MWWLERSEVVHNSTFYAMKTALMTQVNRLHKKRKETKVKKEKKKIVDEINNKIIEFHDTYCLQNEYDLHGMTEKGALKYVEQRVNEVGHNFDLFIVTGRGNHSANGCSAIKNGLMRKFKSRVQINPRNPGEVMLEKREK
ncbi:hypothetical protein GCK72_007672 [Caenorhabditis remanei]|uniref:Smr domain-containing protein n=1 Tax=Caenorhabditis remanei TaxID=31234 RepID=A0A6A5HMX3_CAERE|nr:hypothetical protein GCK72_007672 [Caenorhabditis remanei]KAF1767713.1 hypothetical protein GCK72_007672 [Caenorhabditis remanei]